MFTDVFEEQRTAWPNKIAYVQFNIEIPVLKWQIKLIKPLKHIELSWEKVIVLCSQNDFVVCFMVERLSFKQYIVRVNFLLGGQKVL